MAINGHEMGRLVEVSDSDPQSLNERRITARVYGTAPIDRIEVIRNNIEICTYRGDGDNIQFEWNDQQELSRIALPRNLRGGGLTCYYYLRITQEDGEIAWSSPIWFMLNRTPANPAREQQLNQFASLRSAARGGNARQADETARTQRQSRGQAAVPNLNRQVDGRIRLLASNAQGQQNAPGLAVRQEVGQTAKTPATANQPAAQTTQVTQRTTPSAEDISRANTTPEIQENLQSDTREVAQGLSRDAIRQTQANTQRFAQSAERAAESRSDAVQRESQSEVRQLQTQERELQRDLQQTQQDIRSQRSRAQRATSAASGSTSSAAAAIGSGLNILAG